MVKSRYSCEIGGVLTTFVSVKPGRAQVRDIGPVSARYPERYEGAGCRGSGERTLAWAIILSLHKLVATFVSMVAAGRRVHAEAGLPLDLDDPSNQSGEELSAVVGDAAPTYSRAHRGPEASATIP